MHLTLLRLKTLHNILRVPLRLLFNLKKQKNFYNQEKKTKIFKYPLKGFYFLFFGLHSIHLQFLAWCSNRNNFLKNKLWVQSTQQSQRVKWRHQSVHHSVDKSSFVEISWFIRSLMLNVIWFDPFFPSKVFQVILDVSDSSWKQSDDSRSLLKLRRWSTKVVLPGEIFPPQPPRGYMRTFLVTYRFMSTVRDSQMLYLHSTPYKKIKIQLKYTQ